MNEDLLRMDVSLGGNSLSVEDIDQRPELNVRTGQEKKYEKIVKDIHQNVIDAIDYSSGRVSM
jgi:hypothetical protein